jgi:hypothetical protein
MIADPEIFEPLKAPFPWFGGKSRAAELIWSRLGNVPNYVEPFFGSGAVLLRRPHAPGNEIINDLDCYVANAWRSIQATPPKVASFCDWPVNEADLHARHRWLHGREEFRKRMENDPEYFDARIAAWWIWGISCWIGDNFCRPSRQDSMPNVAGSKGVARQVPHLTGGQGVARKVPASPASMGSATQGGTPHGKAVVSPSGDAAASALEERVRAGRGAGEVEDCRASAALDRWEGRGAESAARIPKQLPDIIGTYGALKSHRGQPGGKGVGKVQGDNLLAWITALSDRLRFTKVCCGDWSRVLTKAATYGQGLTGVLLDPPYDAGDSHDDVYGELSRGVSGKVREWAIANGTNPLLRIALCGYEGEHEMPADWECVAWKAAGGYGNQSGNENNKRERIWFSPACLKPQPELFTL